VATNTPNFDLIKPGVNDPTDQDLWGGYLNSDLDIIDTVMKANEDLAVGGTNAQTGNYTVLDTDQNKTILVDATSGNVIITLIDAATAGDGFKVSVKKTDAAVNTVTVDGTGAQTIDGALTYVLTDRYDAISLVCNGTSWSVLAVVSNTTATGYVQKVVAQDYSVITTTSIIPSARAALEDSVHTAEGFVRHLVLLSLLKMN